MKIWADENLGRSFFGRQRIIHVFYGDVLCTFETERVFPCINV